MTMQVTQNSKGQYFLFDPDTGQHVTVDTVEEVDSAIAAYEASLTEKAATNDAATQAAADAAPPVDPEHSAAGPVAADTPAPDAPVNTDPEPGPADATGPEPVTEDETTLTTDEAEPQTDWKFDPVTGVPISSVTADAPPPVPVPEATPVSNAN